MLTITIPENDLFDEMTNRFIHTKETTIQMEHSLVSVRKWEAKWHIPFLTKDNKTNEQLLDYYRCMTITQHVNPNVYLSLTPENVKAIWNYIDDAHTATWFRETKKGGSMKIITAEKIYYYMIECRIPPEYAKWHLNQLMTLIRVCGEMNDPKNKQKSASKMSRSEFASMARQRSELNAKRLAEIQNGGS